MDYEEKKSIPKHLRGAGTKRFRCPHCHSWHGNVMGIKVCKKNPDRMETVRHLRKIAGVGGRNAMANPVAVAKLRLGAARWSADPKNKARLLEICSKAGRKAPKLGKANPFYGRHHTPENQLKLALGSAAYHRRLAPQRLATAVERLDMPTPIIRNDDFFRPAGGERTQDLWFPVSDTDF